MFGHPYVLVLVDGHSHKFREDLLRAENGGRRAAYLLDEAVRRKLPKLSINPNACRVAVRVYANLARLHDDVLQDATPRGDAEEDEWRVTSPFAASFSLGDALCDFVDVATVRGTRWKVTEMFEAAVEDPKCKHIFLAAWGDAEYLAMLQGRHGDVTLVKGSAMGPGLPFFNFKFVTFSDVFCPGEGTDRILKQYDMAGYASEHPGDLCLLFKKGHCAQGNCTLTHVPIDGVAKRLQQCVVTRADNRARSLARLPIDGPPNRVPVNDQAQRLDLLQRQPSLAEWSAFETRFATGSTRACHHLHLGGTCNNPTCTFDHSDVGPEACYAIRYMMKSKPCPKKGDCRRVKCYYAHLCQKKICREDSEAAERCKMKDVHLMDTEVSYWADGI